MSSMHGEPPARPANNDMLIWSRLMSRHFQAEAASTSLPVSHMGGAAPSSMLMDDILY